MHVHEVAKTYIAEGAKIKHLEKKRQEKEEEKGEDQNRK